MTQGLRELQRHELIDELEKCVVPAIAAQLRSRLDGHCMRVSDLDVDLAVRICERLRSNVPGANVVILTDGTLAGVPAGMAVSSTKLVELRNPMSDGSQRPPLLVFIPAGLRAAAEDSFGVATFEELRLPDVYGELRGRFARDLPTAIRGSLVEGLNRLGGDQPWPFADDVAVVRYLLTAKLNGGDHESYGGALYELGLVPDFNLLSDPTKTPQRLSHNRNCVEQLTWSARSERGRVLDLGLSDREFRARLANFLAEAGLEDPRCWTRRIVLDRALWPMAFNRWEFEDGGEEPDAICIYQVSTDLPALEEDQADERLDQLVGQQVLPLGAKGFKKFSVSFLVEPQPSRVQGLGKFVAQVVSKQQGPVGLVKAKKTWQTGSQQATISFNKLSKVEWEEGWHFVRILPQTDDGELIPLVDEAGKPVPWAAEEDSEAPRLNESDLFYVLPGDEVDVEPPQRAVPKDPSVLHALIRLQFSALAEGRDPDDVALQAVDWSERRAHGRLVGCDQIEARFSREGAVHVPVSRHLKLIEQKILSDAGGPLCWRIPIVLGVAGQSTAEVIKWPRSPSVPEFLTARQHYFQAILKGGKQLVTQATDLRTLRPLVVEYATRYLAVLHELAEQAKVASPLESQKALSDLRRFLSVDTVSVAITDHRQRKREATLVAPTHPLRALWLVTWAELAACWLEQASDAPEETLAPTRDALLRRLAPVSFPPVLSNDSASALLAVDTLNPFWTLYAPSFEEDPRGLLGEVCAAFGLREPAIGGTVIDGEYLASRVQRYLIQHPYVRTLVINAFNAGRGAVLAEMLLALQRMPDFADLRYDVRLFVPDAEAPGVGESIAALLSPSGSIAGKEADAFATPSSSHLYPKLCLAIRPSEEFRADPALHSAHLSMMFDVFPVEDLGVAQSNVKEAIAPVHGLIQDFHVEYREDEASVNWHRQPRHGVALPLGGDSELPSLLAGLSAQLSAALATAVTGQTGVDLRPVITLALNAEQRALLHQIHEVSDWVVTLDRNLGIEFFDHGGKANRPDYLIDHSPEGMGLGGHRLVITSRSVAELEAMLRPVLQSYGLDAQGRHAMAILHQLRSLSGRLALKLISSSTQRAEALGLALSRMFLEHQGVFENQIVVPLDAHLELYHTLKGFAEELGDEVSFKRTDLALFDLNAAARVVTCRLVEVKCYSGVGDVGAYQQLKASAAEQIQQSEEVIAQHFDPHRSPHDRPDRLIKTRELTTLLEFYLDRAERYEVITAESADEARFFLRTMENGYRLAFTRSALIFDFEKPGTDPPELESGIEFHRVGINLIRQLIEAAAPDSESDSGLGVATGPSDDGTPPRMGIEQIRRRRDRATSVPTLDSAAFLVEPRERTVSWAQIGTSQVAGTKEKIPQAEQPPDVSEPPAPAADAPAAKADVPSPAAGLPAPADAEAEVLAEPQLACESELPAEPSNDDPHYDVLLGVAGTSPQYGVLGELSGRKIALDLNHTHTLSLFGVQGGGKSYTLGTIAEMASLQIPRVNRLSHPLATVIFHYSPTMDYRPEFTSMVQPNSDKGEVQKLQESYGACPQALTDVVMLVPGDKLQERRAEYQGIEVYPLKFAASELQSSHWRFLMGAVGNQAAYIRQLNRVMKSLRNDLTIHGLRQGIDKSTLPDQLKELARMRLDLAAEYIDDTAQVRSLIRPGRLIIVDLRDEFIEKDEALGLFVVLLQLFADARYNNENFNKLVVFDEAHKYIESRDLVAGLVEVVREMRHKGTSIMVASQDPPSVPIELIELSSQIILHKFNSPAWLKHIQKANAALGSLTPERMAHLRPGEAYVWSSKATDEAFTKGAVKVKLRPRVTRHGGATKTAVEDNK